ncbi:glycine zipper 2TM domain-containing protein [Pararhodobacter sp.]|uniref:glycine zipper 2TM domain-containing protein n=1 Tax=Pararhodobacter sp. TaxID=2127056 RepID=UPI002AFE2C55|nr:glycine zipper 2TM domain-containing protein [Pararhodobacter sp.]
MKSLLIVALVGSFGLSACTMSTNERTAVGGLAGAAGGLVLANAFGANPNWTILATLGGAAAGALVARNAQTNECAYADGRGGYVTQRCR